MSDTETRPAAQAQVLDFGRRWAAAELAGDTTALGPLLADDFVCVGPLGFVLTKEQYLQSRWSGDLKQAAFSWEDVSVRLYGDAALAVGTQVQRTTYQGRDASGRFRVTQALVRRGGEWVMAGIHLSPIAHPPAGGPPAPAGGPGR
jgi:ketosteroid isomerase-like protein